MPRRGESIPFAFIAEAERFSSNVTPPPRAPLSRSQVLARILTTVTVLAGLACAVLLATPALEPQHAGFSGQQTVSAARR